MKFSTLNAHQLNLDYVPSNDAGRPSPFVSTSLGLRPSLWDAAAKATSRNSTSHYVYFVSPHLCDNFFSFDWVFRSSNACATCL